MSPRTPRRSVRLADRLGQGLVGVLTHVNGVAPAFHSRVKRSMAAERADALEAAPPDGLAGEDAEPRLDLVHPGSRGGREVEREALVRRQRRLDIGGLVGRDVVEDDVHAAPGVTPRYEAQEGQEVGAVWRSAVSIVTLPVPTSSAANRLVVPWRV